MATTTSKLPPVTAWQVESLRMTVFPYPGASFDHAGWWRSLLTTEPDVVNSQPKQGLYQERGKFDDQSALALQVQPGRIDWYCLPSNELPTSSTLAFPLIGQLPKALDDFVALMKRWLPSSPSLARLALGGVLIQPETDKRAGYIRLAGYIPAVRLDLDADDFMYQINRPRPTRTGLPGLRINRLTKWSVALLKHFTFSTGDPVSVADVASASACRLEFDTNTSPDFKGPLLSAKLPALLDEFAGLATEIAAHGDEVTHD